MKLTWRRSIVLISMLLLTAGINRASPFNHTNDSLLLNLLENSIDLTGDHRTIPDPVQQTIPVLPMPRHVEQYRSTAAPVMPGIIAGKGLDNAVKENLWWHWQQFNSETKFVSDQSQQTVTVSLLGKDKSFDAQISKAVATRLRQIGKEGYVLILRNNQRLLAANTEAGLFYGLQTLKQLIRAKWSQEVVITDWPAFDNRVVYDDISRGPISTVDYIKEQIRRMSEIKINYLSFYIEHIVQPVSHPDFAPANGKLTIDQIKELSAYAEKFHMHLIGSFQSFGHFEKILALPQYASLGATSNLISPTNLQAKKFLSDVIGELCDAFDSPWFNVNCDETFDLGQGTTKPYVDSVGAAALYASHLSFLYDIVKQHGKKMMMWGDFVIEHPQVLDMLPKDVVYLTWEYGDQASYDHWIKPFADRKLSYMVCPGILNSYRMFPDMVMAKANIAGFSKAGSERNASGVITTIWDDGGTYLFSGDWYGVYVAAEKSWTTDTTSGSSFDIRYGQTAYNVKNDNYVKALFKLMELRKQPLTYDLNDKLWLQKILPDSNKKLIINNDGAHTILELLNESMNILKGAAPTRNQQDIQTLIFCINQYRLMIDTRVRIANIAIQYKKALASASDKTAAMLTEDIGAVNELTKRYEKLKAEFKQAWLNENQPYWLDVTLAPYDKKIADLTELSASLTKTAEQFASQHSLLPASQLRLSIEVNDHFYFQNWMLTGPFPVVDQQSFPAFLYADSKEYNKPPSPGDFSQYQGKLYRWRKFVSPDGGIIDLDQSYEKSGNAFIYAYCSISTDTTATVQAYLGSANSTEIFCNGAKLTTQQEETGMLVKLPLKKGVNNILVKLNKQAGKDNSFTFHLDNKDHVTNHKHKYKLNEKTESYDAE